MSEYIKREDATAVISTTVAEGCLQDTLMARMKDVPSVDLPTKVIAKVEYDGDKLQDIVNNTLNRNDIVQVVRCKDCIHSMNCLRIRGALQCILLDDVVFPNWFCSRGERKDNEKTIFLDETIDETCGYGKDGESE